MNKLAPTLSVCLLLAACGDQAATPDKLVFDSDVRSPFRYEFFDEEGECSTGLQTFDSLTRMCIHVQDPERNNACAEDDRRRHCPGSARR
ncbi:MAG: hypothetical protein AAFQ82_05190, partial [Myxococcota bacterium]